MIMLGASQDCQQSPLDFVLDLETASHGSSKGTRQSGSILPRVFEMPNDPSSGLQGEFDLIFWYGWAATGISVGIRDCSSSLT